MNILLLSVGTRNKIVQYFRNALSGVGKVVAADCSDFAPALYEADAFHIVSPISSKTYIDEILEICKKDKIDGILSLIDPELSLIAKNRELFIRIGAIPIVSDYDVVKKSFDKMMMHKELVDYGYNTANSFDNLNTFFKAIDGGVMNYPVFVKPINGSASININEANSKEEIEFLFGRYDGLMIQKFLKGREIGVDAYIDVISGEVVSIFLKEKIKMRAGETDKARSFKDEMLFKLIERFLIDFRYKGPVDIDIFEVNGDYYISEVNPRFGGGYPHAYECGVDHMKMIVNNLMGTCNNKVIGDYDSDVYMMKYNEVCIRKNDGR